MLGLLFGAILLLQSASVGAQVMPDTVRAGANDSALTLAYSSANRILWRRVSADGRLLDTVALVLRSANPTIRIVRLTELDGTIPGMRSDQQTVVTRRSGQRPDQHTFHAAESEANRGRYVPLAIVALCPDTLALLVPRLMPKPCDLGGAGRRYGRTSRGVDTGGLDGLGESHLVS
jgi:hypothetical protein